MAVVNRNETNTDLGEVAEAGIHLPEATADHSENHPDGQDHDHRDDQEHGFELLEVLRVVFVALAAAAVWFHLWEPFHRVSVIGLVATLIGGYPIFKEAFENIVERRMTMELSMTIALVSALAIGEFFTALVITAFVLAAEILEGLTVGRGRRAIQDMLNFLPQTASVLRGDQIVEVNTKTILPGEIVVIRPGGRIPVDGTVINGHSFVEQAAITGEPAAMFTRVPSIRPVRSRSVPNVWGRRQPSARSSRQSRMRSARAPRYRRPLTDLPGIWFTSPLARRCSHFSLLTTSGPQSQSLLSPELVA
jgi:cation transport ATPase